MTRDAVPWAEDLPPQWTVTKLGRLLFDGPRNGVSPALAERESGARSCSISVVRNGRVVVTEDEIKWVAATPQDVARFDVRRGDLLLVRGNGNLDLVGRCGYVDSDLHDLVYPDLLMRLRVRRGVSARLLQFTINSSVVRDQMEAAARTTVGTYKVNNEQVRQIRVPQPPLAAQERIATFLERKTDAIDALVEKKGRLVALLDEKRHALVTHAVTRGLDPDVPMRDTGDAWIGRVPAHWSVVRVGYLASIANGSTPRRDNEAYWAHGTIPWLNSTRINDGEIRNAEQFVTADAVRECHLPLVRTGAVLVAITGEGQTRGRAALLRLDTTINQHLAAFTITDSRLSSAFLWRQLQARYDWLRFESSGAGSTRAALTCEFLRSIPVVLPPLAEQESITSKIESSIARLEAVASATTRSIDLLREHRQALVTAAVTGKLDLSKQEAS